MRSSFAAAASLRSKQNERDAWVFRGFIGETKGAERKHRDAAGGGGGGTLQVSMCVRCEFTLSQENNLALHGEQSEGTIA
jgi:hypothetical protein